MEETFWANLEQICAKQELVAEDYITRAKDYIGAAGRQFPNMRIDLAVRLRVAQDLRDQARCLLARAANSDHSVHEAVPVPPVTLPTARH